MLKTMNENKNEIPLESILNEKKPVLFLDYDGTLTPIVKRPEDAILSPGMKQALEDCASLFSIAVISGRDLDDLKDKVKIDTLIYAGSHGFRISGPGGLYKEHEQSEEILPELDRLEKKMNEISRSIDQGIQIDRKRYAIAVHYRNAEEENVPDIIRKVNKLMDQTPGFKVGGGKKIVEIRPDVDWDKGKALLWIMQKLGVTDKKKFIPFYIGDDVTDEDAFKVIQDDGWGILVGPEEGKKSAARFTLPDVNSVKDFLHNLASTVKKE